MNTQHRKLLAIAAVILFHGVVITVMLAQHGCKSDGASAPGAADAPAPVPEPVVAAAATPAPMPAATSDGFVAPTRPPPETPVTPIPVAQFSEPLYTPGPGPATVSTPAPAAPAAATPSAPAAGPTVTWIVSNKDSLYTIARKNGITVDELIAANAPKITRATILQPGMSLIIPSSKTPSAAATAATAAPAAADSGNTYKVAAGDSLGKIAAKNHTTVKALKEINGLTSDSIRAGQMLKLPAAGAAPAAATPSLPAADENSYTVKSGDSLDKIARAVHVSSGELMALNGLTAETARLLRPGRVLKLPSGVHAPAATTAAMPTSTTLPPVTMPSTAMPAGASLPPVTMPASAMPVTGTGAPPMTPVQQ